MQRHTLFFPITYSATDVAIYQQDVVIHRSKGVSYEETVGGLKVWHVYIGPKCRPDYGDLRFTDRREEELAYYLWPGYDATSARICVRLEGADRDGVLTAHYGNAAAETTSDGDAVYHFFDDFLGTAVDTSKWTGSCTVANSWARLPSGSGWLGIESNASFGLGRTLQFRGRLRLGPIFCGFIDAATSPRCCFRSSGSNHVGTNRISSDAFTGSFGWDNDNHVWEVRRHDSHATFARDGDEKDLSYQYPTSDLNIFLKNDYATGSAETYIDWVLVRAYSATPPAATAFGPEQAPGTLHHVQGVVFGSANMMVI